MNILNCFSGKGVCFKKEIAKYADVYLNIYADLNADINADLNIYKIVIVSFMKIFCKIYYCFFFLNSFNAFIRRYFLLRFSPFWLDLLNCCKIEYIECIWSSGDKYCKYFLKSCLLNSYLFIRFIFIRRIYRGNN